MRLSAALLCTCMISIPSYTASEVPTQDFNVSLLNNLQGEWISEGFIRKVRETHSVLKALKEFPIVGFQIRKGDRTYIWMRIFNWHEGGSKSIVGLTTIDAGNKSYRIDSKDALSDDIFVVDNTSSPSHLKWVRKDPGYSRSVSDDFIRGDESSVQAEVSRSILGGTYKTPNGQTYSFGERGVAHWGEHDCRYKVDLDLMETGYDSLTMKGSGCDGIYGYKRSGKILLLFKTHPNQNGIPEKEPAPFMTLVAE